MALGVVLFFCFAGDFTYNLSYPPPRFHNSFHPKRYEAFCPIEKLVQECPNLDDEDAVGQIYPMTHQSLATKDHGRRLTPVPEQCIQFDCAPEFVLFGYPLPDSSPDVGQGCVSGENAQAMQSNFVSAYYGVDGEGIKVGVISNTFERCSQDTTPFCFSDYEFDLATGDLPSGDKEIKILLDDNIETAPIDEGRAMCQLIYDVANETQMFYHTGTISAESMAAGIRELRDRGCDIIVDDIRWDVEPWFFDGQISQAANEVVEDDGVVFFSAAGNEFRNSWNDTFNGVQDADLTKLFEDAGVSLDGAWFHDFDGMGETKQMLTYTDPPNFDFKSIMVFQWDDFWTTYGDPEEGPDYDFDLYFFHFPDTSAYFPGGPGSGAQTCSEVNLCCSDLVPEQDPGCIQILGFGNDSNDDGDPFEFVEFELPNIFEIYVAIVLKPTPEPTPAPKSTKSPKRRRQVEATAGRTSKNLSKNQRVLSHNDGPPQVFMKWFETKNGPGFGHIVDIQPPNGGFSSTVIGHRNAKNVASVGQVFWPYSPFWPFGNPTDQPILYNPLRGLDPANALGGTPLLRDPNGKRKEEPVYLLQPKFVGPDGISNTFFGQFETLEPDDNNNNDATPYFFGSSAAAPSVAAVAALMKQANFDLSPFEIYKILEETAIPMTTPPNVETAPNSDQPLDLAVGFDFQSGYGYVNALAAMSKVCPAEVSVSLDERRRRRKALQSDETVDEIGLSEASSRRQLKGSMENEYEIEISLESNCDLILEIEQVQLSVCDGAVEYNTTSNIDGAVVIFEDSDDCGIFFDSSENEFVASGSDLFLSVAAAFVPGSGFSFTASTTVVPEMESTKAPKAPKRRRLNSKIGRSWK